MSRVRIEECEKNNIHAERSEVKGGALEIFPEILPT